ncbi:MAG: O-antigen ligase family protein [Acidimicrobiales bacterium]
MPPAPQVLAPPRPAPRPEPPTRLRHADLTETLSIAVALVIGHAVLGVAMTYSTVLASAVAALTLVGALGLAAFSKRIEMGVLAAVYVGSSDVLWRMTNAKVPWESGKYVFTLALLIVLARFVRPLRRPFVPLLYLLVLLPSCAIAVWQLGPGLARGEMAATLAGPIALGVAVLAFRQLIATEAEARRLLWAVIGPAVAVAAIATKATIAAGTIRFTGESNFVTSGGYGPNQVSNILGGGAVCCLLVALSHAPLRVRILSMLVGAWLVGQALLTLSRGGVWGFVAAGVCIGLAGLLTSGTRSRVLTIGVVVVLAAVLVYSWVNLFTAGSLANRYADQSSTNRSDIARGDLALFADNPLFGVGPGVSKYVRTGVKEADGSTHTEYSRLLAEHGVFGVVALVLLVTMLVQALRSTTTTWNRFVTTGAGVYALFTMSHSATRIAVIAVMFGLASLRIEWGPVPAVAAPGPVTPVPPRPVSYRRALARRTIADR